MQWVPSLVNINDFAQAGFSVTLCSFLGYLHDDTPTRLSGTGRFNSAPSMYSGINYAQKLKCVQKQH